MNFIKHSVLLIILSSFSMLGLAQFTVNQNITYSSPSTPACYNTTITDQSSQWQGTTVNVDVSHNISSSTNPNIVQNMNAQAKRYMHFDIYHDTGSQLQFVKTVTKYNDWLIPSSTSYNLGIFDLLGTPDGNTVVILRVKYVHTANSPHVTNLFVDANGQSLCSYLDFENTTLECTVGQIDCFDYHPCGRVNVTGSASLCQTPAGPGVCYNFTSSIPNGSGNYTYYWTASYANGKKSGSNSTFSFWTTAGGHPEVTLYVVDNVTGCEYYFNSTFKKEMEFDLQIEDALNVGPNPATRGQEVTLNYLTESSGKVSISLFDLQGREVQRIHDASIEAEGIQSLNFVPEVPAGLYMIGIKTANGLASQKLIIQE